MIHPQAIVDPSAKLAPDVEVGPWSMIGPNVEIGPGTIIAPHVIIKGPAKIGAGNQFFQFSSIGEDPQDKKFNLTDESRLEIGDNNVFRENVTVNRGTGHGGGITRIGNNNLLMACVHVAHDCLIGNHVVFSNNTALAGHVTVRDYANIGGFVGIFQFCTIGEYAFLGGGSMVIKDVPPFVSVSGYPAKVCGINKVGLKRSGYSEATLLLFQRAYKALYRKGLTLKESIEEIEKLIPDAEELKTFLDFIKQERSRAIIR